MQLTYGDDGLDPVAMEAQEGKPVDLTRSLSVVHATTPRRPQLPENAMEDGAPAGPPIKMHGHSNITSLFCTV